MGLLITDVNSCTDRPQLTWGVFPNCEVLQPTIFDPDTFHVWKNEAFKVLTTARMHACRTRRVSQPNMRTPEQLWTTIWAAIYDDESASNALIHSIHDTYFLVAIIDNDFIIGSLWSLFHELVGLTGASGGSGAAPHQYALP